MGLFGIIGKAVGATTKYAGARSKERTTALGGGLCIAALYFRVERPDAVNEVMFYIVFAVGLLMALLKSEFMARIGEACLENARKASGKKRKK